MSRTAYRAVLAIVVAVLLLMLVTWVAWLGVQPSHAPKSAVHTASLAAANQSTRVIPVDQPTCVALETAYLQAHPERTDLHVNGKDCNRAQSVSAGAPPGSGPTAITMSTCQGYWEDDYLNVWGFIQVGYIQLYIGVCYNGSTVWHQYGPVNTVTFWPPNMKGWTDYDGYYGSGTSQLTVYSESQGELWEPVIGWCCDKYFYNQYTINASGNWWWS